MVVKVKRTGTSARAIESMAAARQAKFCPLIRGYGADPSARNYSATQQRPTAMLALRHFRFEAAKPLRLRLLDLRDLTLTFFRRAQALAPTFFIPRQEDDLSTLPFSAAERRRRKRMNEAIRCQC